MDRSKGIGSLSCRLCGASYQMPIHHLSEPIDVFSEWLDDCEAADRQNRGLPPTRSEGSSNAHGNGREYDDDDDDDLIEKPSGLHQSSSNGPKSSGESLKRKAESAANYASSDESDD
jgi:transcription elongation factor Elf1